MSNAVPDQLRTITEKEFAQSNFFTYSPDKVEYRQVHGCSDEITKQLGYDRQQMIELRLYYMTDGGGFALHNNYWKGTIHFLKFGCEHNYRELSQLEAVENNVSHYGMCYHVYKCQTCGHIMAQDSSD